MAQVPGLGGTGRDATEDPLRAAAILDIDLVEQGLQLTEMLLRLGRLHELGRHAAAENHMHLAGPCGCRQRYQKYPGVNVMSRLG